MRLPHVRFTLRRLMIVVAAAATFMAAWMEIARWKERRRRCEILLDVYGENPFQQWANLTHDQWLAWCRDVDEKNVRGQDNCCEIGDS